jgi:predicted nucleic acid-binding protein
VSTAVCDASVAFKWLSRDGEEELAAADRLLDAWLARQVHIVSLDLVLYELGNALTRGRDLPAAQVTELLDRVAAIFPEPRRLTPDLRFIAAHLADLFRLTYYDAAHLALAWLLKVPLITADRALLAAGGISPTAFIASLN